MVLSPTAGLGEFGRIAQLLAPLAAAEPASLGLTDDAAVLAVPAGMELVVTADAVVEGVHFLLDDPPDLIARKLLRVNLSDLAAMAARPRCYVLTMALPARCDDSWVERFAAGLAEDQARYGVALAGGDSVGTPGPVTLSITALGLAPAGRAVRRAGAAAGDVVYVSGTIGDGALGLMAATGRLPGLDPGHRAALIDRYRLPEPRLALGAALAGLAHAMLDVSDGLMADLGHLARLAGIGAEIDTTFLPLSDAAAAVLADELTLIETVVTGGDDYELLFTAPRDAHARIEAAARAAGVPVTAIGRMVAAPGLKALDRDGRTLDLVRHGWQHG